jgi:hypothetical protein
LAKAGSIRWPSEIARGFAPLTAEGDRGPGRAIRAAAGDIKERGPMPDTQIITDRENALYRAMLAFD